MAFTKFVPCNDGEASPPRIDSLREVETPQRVVLNELPVGTIIEFYGVHRDSKYICKIVGPKTKKRIKVWFKGNSPCAIAPIEEIVSRNAKIFDEPSEVGVMEIKRNYYLPHFYYQNVGTPQKKLMIDRELRTEPYTKIYIKRP